MTRCTSGVTCPCDRCAKDIRDWECSRCGSFGTVEADTAPHCDCDETDDNLRARIEALEAEVRHLEQDRDDLRSELTEANSRDCNCAD